MGLFDKGKLLDDNPATFDGKEPMLQFTVLYATVAFFFCIVTGTLPSWIFVLYGVIFGCWVLYKGSILFWRLTRGHALVRFTILYGLVTAPLFSLVAVYGVDSANLPGVAGVLAVPYVAVLFCWLLVKTLKAMLRLVSSRKQERQQLFQARQISDAQRRREDARASCEVFFATYAPEIGERFTRAMFDAFLTRHMSDQKSAEEVEQRARELRGILQQHLEKAQGPVKRKTLADLAQWFLGEKQQIEAAALTDADKQMLLTQLEERYVKLQEQYLRSVHP